MFLCFFFLMYLNIQLFQHAVICFFSHSFMSTQNVNVLEAFILCCRNILCFNLHLCIAYMHWGFVYFDLSCNKSVFISFFFIQSYSIVGIICTYTLIILIIRSLGMCGWSSRVHNAAVCSLLIKNVFLPGTEFLCFTLIIQRVLYNF